jgi:hypothetical protein
MKLSDLLQRYAKQSPQLREGPIPPAETPSVERKGGILHQANDHANLPTAPNNGSNQQHPLLGQAPVQDETSQSGAVKVWSDVLQAAVWVVRDDLPRVEWPHDAAVYTQREVRLLTKIGHDVLQWVNPVKEIFNAKVVAAHGATTRSPSHRGNQRTVDVLMYSQTTDAVKVWIITGDVS